MNSAHGKVTMNERTEIIRFCDEWLKREEEIILPMVRERQAAFSQGVFNVIPRVSDALRLKKLEEFFPCAKIVLTTENNRGVVSYVYEDVYEDSHANHMIACDFSYYSHTSFSSLGVKGRPQLTVEWNGIHINLSHLF